jgi:hypothetical protein
MRLENLVEQNAYHRAFYADQKKRTHYLLQRQYIKQFIQNKFVVGPMRGFDPSPVDAYQRLRFKPSFESQIIKHASEAEAAGLFEYKKLYARQPRRKAAGNGPSRRQLVGDFSSRATNAFAKTKWLWDPFFDKLVRLGLNPSKSADGGIYEYDGKRGRLTISYRQFEKLVSELAPRRKRKPNA